MQPTAYDPNAAAAPVLAVRAISKSFAAVQALADVSLSFAAGQVHTLLGENGAGKSTLMNILNGGVRPDGGEIVIDGVPVRLSSPRVARRYGIGMVHQHFTLIDALTVDENLATSFAAPGEWRYDAATVAARAAAFARSLGLSVAAGDRLVGDLPVGVRQHLEILKALAGAVRVLILDEPTAVLTPAEIEQLFVVLRRLRGLGCSILFITHKLREALAISDSITLLRRGRIAGTFAASSVDEAQLAARMIGSEDEEAARDPVATARPMRAAATPVLQLDGVGVTAGGRALLGAVSMQVAEGEILGIAGVDGNGQSELFELLVGLRQAECGTISLAGAPLHQLTPAAAIAAGIAHIPPDRQRDGLILAMSVRDNCVLSRKLLDQCSRQGWLDRRRIAAIATGVTEAYAVRHGGLDTAVRSLSGGNQQKIVVGRELAIEPRVLVAVNPTRGLDLTASRAVGDALRRAAAQGCAVVLISTDLDEVRSLSDAVRVLYRGRLSPPLLPPFEVARLGALMAGAAD